MLRNPVGPTARARRARRAKRQREAKSVYQQVDARDGCICRSCGDFRGDWRQQHHITYRSQGGEETTANLVTLCSSCHTAVHDHWLRIIGDDADGELRFERAS